MNFEHSTRPFHELLQLWRKRMGYTRKQAAEALGVPVSTLHGWIVGRICGQEKSMRKLMQLTNPNA